MDADITIKQLKEMFCDFRNKMNWRKVHSLENLAKALSVEANELLKLFLWDSDAMARNDAETLKACKYELADILMLCLSLADVLNCDLHEIVMEKMKIHAKKYGMLTLASPKRRRA